MASTIKSKYALIDKKRISQKAQDVLNDIADATDNFKKVSPQLRKEFNTFYDKLKAAKPEAIKGTKEYKEFGKEGAPQPKATPEPSDALKNAIKKARELRKAQGIRYDRDSIERDAARPALKAGKRKSKDGNTYYEYRENRIDRKPAKYPKLSHGGKPLSYFTYETPMVTILWNGKAQPLGRFKSAQEALDEIRKVSGGIESEMLRYSIKTPDDVIPVKDVLFAGGGKASGKYTVYLYFGGENPSETHHVASLKEAKSLAMSAEHAEIIDSNGVMVEFSGYDDDEDGGEMKVEISNDFRGGKGKSTATLNGKRISVDEANRLIKENNLKLAEDTMYSNVAWKTYTKSGNKFAGGGKIRLFSFVLIQPTPENKLAGEKEGMVVNLNEKDGMALVRTDINRLMEKTEWYKLSDLKIAKGNESRLFEEGGSTGHGNNDKIEEAMYALHYMIVSNSFTQDGVKNVRAIINQYGTDEQKQLMSEIPAVGFHTRTDDFSQLYYSLKKSVQGNEYEHGGSTGQGDLFNEVQTDTHRNEMAGGGKPKMVRTIFEEEEFEYANGGRIYGDEGFYIRDLKEHLQNEFPDSFKFIVERPKKNTRVDYELIPDSSTGLSGLTDADTKSKLYFPQYKRDHEVSWRIYQGQENTYFFFYLTDDNGNPYIGTFGFKDRGDVDSSYITRFIAFLMSQYGLPFQVKHDIYALGGRPKSALMRDRAYQSEEEWEKNYERAGRPKHPKYKYEDGGGVSAAEMLSITGSWKITAYDTNRGMRADISMPAPFDVTVKRLNRMLANSEWNFLTQHHIERA